MKDDTANELEWPQTAISRTTKYKQFHSLPQKYSVCNGWSQLQQSGVIYEQLFTADKIGGKCFCPCSFVCLSIYLLARLPKNAFMDLDEMLRADRCRDMDELINFWARSGL